MKNEENRKEENAEGVFVLRPYTHKELAQLYNVCWVTFQRWMKKKEDEIGKKQGHFYHVRQVIRIFKIYGIPKRFKVTMQEVERMFTE